MSKVICEMNDIVAIADAVRNKTGNNNKLSIEGIVDGINDLSNEQQGEDVTTETNTYTTKLVTLETAITALETELQGKASGGSGSDSSVETCTVHLSDNSGSIIWLYTDANMQLQTTTVPAVSSLDIIIPKNTIVTFYSNIGVYGNLSKDGECEIILNTYGAGAISIYDDCQLTFNGIPMSGG